jgi:single-stranded-DNA-specific exonuclease
MGEVAESRSSPWRTPTIDLATQARLQAELGLQRVTAAALVVRGVIEPDKAQRFLNPSLDQLHNPGLLPDYAAARDAILDCRERNLPIYVHGDYDVDGVTSAAIFARFLAAIGCQVHGHVPHRFREGYGIHRLAVEEAKSLGTHLFLTCDCGIAAHEAVDSAKALGMRVVVTDHHSAPEILPGAEALVNPHRADSTYPFRELSGAGIAYKLCLGLARELGMPEAKFHAHFLDLAALGTVSDCVPLLDENRVITWAGLSALHATKKAGLRALLNSSDRAQKARLDTDDISFGLGPRINAAGRVQESELAYRLLMSTDTTESARMAQEIERLNDERRAEQTRIVDEAVARAAATDPEFHPVIVLHDAGWHLGIVGIAASKVVEATGRPAFLLGTDPTTGRIKGSARSIPGFDLARLIRNFPELVSGGGHAMAAGVQFAPELLNSVEEAFRRYGAELLETALAIDAAPAEVTATPEELTLAVAEELERFAPFGFGNPPVRILAPSMELREVRSTKNERVVQLVLGGAEGQDLKGVSFKLASRLRSDPVPLRIDAIGRVSVDRFRSPVPQFELLDYQPSVNGACPQP